MDRPCKAYAEGSRIQMLNLVSGLIRFVDIMHPYDFLKTISKSISFTFMLYLCTSSVLFAADLVLDCKVRGASNDGSQHDYTKRLEFTWDPPRLNVYVSTHSGFRLTERG